MFQLPPRLVTLLLASFAGGSLVSCTSDSSPDGNIFLTNPPPRYGHGGTSTPRYKYGATEVPEEARSGGTQYLAERMPLEPVVPGEVRDDRPATGDPAPVRDPAGDPRPWREPTVDPAGSAVTEAPPRTVPPPVVAEAPAPAPAPKPAPKPAPSEEIPYATPVPGQPGKVYSPFHNGGYVEVSGMQSGSKARCPYTKKIFRVP